MKVGDQIQGRFLIQRRVGAGGMGEVFAATDSTSSRMVAVKVLLGNDPDAAGRFDREANILERVRHPNVVAYIGHGRSETGEAFLVMEWLEGETLKDRIQRAPMTFTEVIDIALGIARALADVHALGVIHRDLKPANVFLVGRRADEVRVLDFGVARLRGGAAQLTVTGEAIGTPHYMSPEQAVGSNAIDSKTDLFSFGALLFRCVAGRTPFQAGSAVGVLFEVVHTSAPTIRSMVPDTPPRIARVIDTLLRRDPAERPPSAQAVFSELVEIRKELAGPSKPIRTHAQLAVPETALQQAQGQTPLSAPYFSEAQRMTPLAGPFQMVAPVALPAPPTSSPLARAMIIAGAVALLAGIVIAVSAVAYSNGVRTSRKDDAPERRKMRAQLPPKPTATATATSQTTSSPFTTPNGMPIVCTMNSSSHCAKVPHQPMGLDEIVGSMLGVATQLDPKAALAAGQIELDPSGNLSMDRFGTSILTTSTWIVTTQKEWMIAVQTTQGLPAIPTQCRLSDLYKTAVASGLDVSTGSTVVISSIQISFASARICTTPEHACKASFDSKTCRAPAAHVLVVPTPARQHPPSPTPDHPLLL
jgi:serine/threonine protein kinase